jgi:hypothetical protein
MRQELKNRLLQYLDKQACIQYTPQTHADRPASRSMVTGPKTSARLPHNTMTIHPYHPCAFSRVQPHSPQVRAEPEDGADQVGTRPGRTATYGSWQSWEEPRESPDAADSETPAFVDDLLARKRNARAPRYCYSATSRRSLVLASYLLARRLAAGDR